ncbi:MAG: hypothetical protein MZU97_10785 [Bacillus subtilis]|nr:hypothetical protein [Bacillus subtilis]
MTMTAAIFVQIEKGDYFLLNGNKFDVSLTFAQKDTLLGRLQAPTLRGHDYNFKKPEINNTDAIIASRLSAMSENGMNEHISKEKAIKIFLDKLPYIK